MNPGEEPPQNSRQGRDFEKLVIWISTFSIGLLAGLLASIKQLNPFVHFQFSAFSVLAFFVGGALTLMFLRSLLGSNKRWRALLVVVVAAATLLGYFAFGIKYVSSENRRDVTIGTAVALAVLTFAGWLLWRVGRFFERDQQRNREESK